MLISIDYATFLANINFGQRDERLSVPSAIAKPM